MQFRDRGSSVRLIRTGYDAEAKKPTSEVIGKLQRPKMALDDDVRAKLTAEELQEVEAYRQGILRSEGVAREFAAQSLKDHLKLAMEWLAAAPAAEAKTFAGDIQRPLKQLKRELEKVVKPEQPEAPTKKSSKKSKAADADD